MLSTIVPCIEKDKLPIRTSKEIIKNHQLCIYSHLVHDTGGYELKFDISKVKVLVMVMEDKDDF